MTEAVNADLVDGIKHAISMIAEHVDTHMDYDSIPEDPDPALCSLQGISHHLKGTLELTSGAEHANPEISEGFWWVRCTWNGGLEVVHVKQNQLSDGFRVAMLGAEQQRDGAGLLEEYELISRISEPV